VYVVSNGSQNRTLGFELLSQEQPADGYHCGQKNECKNKFFISAVLFGTQRHVVAECHAQCECKRPIGIQSRREAESSQSVPGWFSNLEVNLGSPRDAKINRGEPASESGHDTGMRSKLGKLSLVWREMKRGSERKGVDSAARTGKEQNGDGKQVKDPTRKNGVWGTPAANNRWLFSPHIQKDAACSAWTEYFDSGGVGLEERVQ
jgi:hypothetical protein